MGGRSVRLEPDQMDSVATKLLRACQENKFIPDGEIDWQRFHSFRTDVRDGYYVPATAITTMASRFLFGIGSLKRPRTVVGIGTYYGNALSWLAAPGFSRQRSYDGIRAIGIDTDESAVLGFRDNANRAGLAVEVICADGIRWLEEFPDPIDVLYLDLDTPMRGKADYFTCVNVASKLLQPGAVVVAHDFYEEKFENDMINFRDGLAAHGAQIMGVRTDVYGFALALF
jgi:predicted O-methyltransferase YrrM